MEIVRKDMSNLNQRIFKRNLIFENYERRDLNIYLDSNITLNCKLNFVTVKIKYLIFTRCVQR